MQSQFRLLWRGGVDVLVAAALSRTCTVLAMRTPLFFFGFSLRCCWQHFFSTVGQGNVSAFDHGIVHVRFFACSWNLSQVFSWVFRAFFRVAMFPHARVFLLMLLFVRVLLVPACCGDRVLSRLTDFTEARVPEANGCNFSHAKRTIWMHSQCCLFWRGR